MLIPPNKKVIATHERVATRCIHQKPVEILPTPHQANINHL